MLNFHDLYDNYAKDVFHFSLWMTGDKFEAEDITSETMIRAWGKRGKIRTETLKAYLFTIARNLYLGKKISISAAKVKVHRVRKKLLINFLEKEVV